MDSSFNPHEFTTTNTEPRLNNEPHPNSEPTTPFGSVCHRKMKLKPRKRYKEIEKQKDDYLLTIV